MERRGRLRFQAEHPWAAAYTAASGWRLLRPAPVDGTYAAFRVLLPGSRTSVHPVLPDWGQKKAIMSRDREGGLWKLWDQGVGTPWTCVVGNQEGVCPPSPPLLS